MNIVHVLATLVHTPQGGGTEVLARRLTAVL